MLVPSPSVKASTTAVMRRRSRSQPSAKIASGTAVPSMAGRAMSVSLAMPLVAAARIESAPTVRIPAAASTTTATAANRPPPAFAFSCPRLRLGSSQGMSRARWKRSRVSVTCPDFGVRTQPPSFFSKSALIEAYAWNGTSSQERPMNESRPSASRLSEPSRSTPVRFMSGRASAFDTTSDHPKTSPHIGSFCPRMSTPTTQASVATVKSTDWR